MGWGYNLSMETFFSLTAVQSFVITIVILLWPRSCSNVWDLSEWGMSYTRLHLHFFMFNSIHARQFRRVFTFINWVTGEPPPTLKHLLTPSSILIFGLCCPHPRPRAGACEKDNAALCIRSSHRSSDVCSHRPQPPRFLGLMWRLLHLSHWQL